MTTHHIDGARATDPQAAFRPPSWIFHLEVQGLTIRGKPIEGFTPPWQALRIWREGNCWDSSTLDQPIPKSHFQPKSKAAVHWRDEELRHHFGKVKMEKTGPQSISAADATRLRSGSEWQGCADVDAGKGENSAEGAVAL